MRQLFLLLFLVIAATARAQDTIPLPKHIVYLEVLGVSPPLSANYERLLYAHCHGYMLTGRIGLGLFTNETLINPVFAYGLYNNFGLKKSVYLEAGLTGTVLRDRGNRYDPARRSYTHYHAFGAWVSPTIGLRLMNKDGVFIGLSYMPLFDLTDVFDHRFENSFGIRWGYSF